MAGNFFDKIEKRQREIRESEQYKPFFDFLKVAFAIIAVIFFCLFAFAFFTR